MPVLFHVREQVICLECRYLDRIKAFAVSIMGKEDFKSKKPLFQKKIIHHCFQIRFGHQAGSNS